MDWTTSSNSTLTGPAIIPVATFSEACNGGVCIPQLGTKQQLDSLGDRLMYRLAYWHFADGHEALVANHSVNSGNGIVGPRWYELLNPPWVARRPRHRLVPLVRSGLVFGVWVNCVALVGPTPKRAPQLRASQTTSTGVSTTTNLATCY